MRAYNILKKMLDSKLVVVIRGDATETAKKTAVSCVNGGIKALEITFTVPRADHLISELNHKYKDVTIGAGTVLDSETAHIAILSGAEFIVSPVFNVDTAKLCSRYGIPYLPGCMSVNEIMKATEYGISVVKLFPGNIFSPSFIKNIHNYLPYINIMPTGGIIIENVRTWLDAGAAIVGIGGEITNPAKENNYSEVMKLATEFQSAVKM